MSAETTLCATYQEWQRLAEAEGKAIRRRNWNFLLECQSVIKKLQPPITRLTREAAAEWKQSGADLAAKKNELRSVVTRLMTLAQQNRSELITAQAIAKTEREQVEQARQNLKRLQHSYVNTRPAAWSSFS
jgi:hypothetical protein